MKENEGKTKRPIAKDTSERKLKGKQELEPKDEKENERKTDSEG